MARQYWYIDCPTWVHDRKQNKWKGPLFDPKKLETEAGRAEIRSAHLCGAYLRNRVRNCGLLDPEEKPDAEAIAAISGANRETMEWVGEFR